MIKIILIMMQIYHIIKYVMRSLIPASFPQRNSSTLMGVSPCTSERRLIMAQHAASTSWKLVGHLKRRSSRPRSFGEVPLPETSQSVPAAQRAQVPIRSCGPSCRGAPLRKPPRRRTPSQPAQCLHLICDVVLRSGQEKDMRI